MEPSNFKWIVGSGECLAWAADAWREAQPGLHVETIEIGQDQAYAFDLAALDATADASGFGAATAFVALGPQFVNFRRFELMGALKERGLKLPPLICRGAVLAPNAVVGENAWVGPGAIVAAGVRLGYNCFVGPGAILGPRCVVGNSAWVEAGVIAGSGCRIGAQSIIGLGVLLAKGVEVGKSCVVDKPGRYDRDIPSRTFFNPDFDAPIVVVGA